MKQHCPHVIGTQRAFDNTRKNEGLCCYCGQIGRQTVTQDADPAHGPYAPAVDVFGEWKWPGECVERKMRVRAGRSGTHDTADKDDTGDNT